MEENKEVSEIVEKEKIPEPEFVHLRVHTIYSLLEGAIRIEDISQKCRSLNMPAIAMTDTNQLFGAAEFSDVLLDKGIQPIIGVQQCIDIGLENKGGARSDDRLYSDIILLCMNEQGYDSIRKLSEFSYMATPNDEKPHIRFNELQKYNAGLICLTGGVKGPLGRYVKNGNMEFAEKALLRLKECFNDRLYMEIQRHGLPDEDKTENGFIDLAYKHNIPLVATNEAFFKDRDFFEAHDVFLCIRDKLPQAFDNRTKLNEEFYLKSQEEMKELFADLPEAIANTVKIAKRCQFYVGHSAPALPVYPDCIHLDLPEEEERQAIYDKIRCYLKDEPSKNGKPGRTVQEQLDSRTLNELREALTVQTRARDGLEIRMKDYVYKDDMSEEERKALHEKYFARLEYELSVIIKMKFSGYFLIVSDFINWSKDNGIPVGPGRGSGAGSIVAWSIRVTNLDPLKFDLLFERFLNPDRVNMPDFDVDFCQSRRGETIEYVRRKYGKDKVAQILTVGKMQAKVVLHDVGRALQLNWAANKLAKLVPNKPGTTLKQAYEQEPGIAKFLKEEPKSQKVWDISVKLEGLYRQSGTHAAGVVVGQRSLNEIVPVYRDFKSDSELPVTQYNMQKVEATTGLIKFDFLGLKTLTVIKEAVNMVNDRMKKEGKTLLNIDAISISDPKTYELLQRGETEGVFQLESSGMKSILKDMMPTTFEEIIALISLYRPGPMDNIPQYIKVKKGEEEPDYMHPMLEEILKETNGIMIYQEQVMQISKKMGGYTMGEADHLRKIMGKKKVKELPPERVKFIEGAKKNGVDEALAESIFEKMAKFASYGFNKSHAAAYALVSYQTAYLKTHYPAEFMAATMTFDKSDTEKLYKYKAELTRLKIKLLPPSLNNSFTNFSVENQCVRYALSAIKGSGDDICDKIVKERVAHGPYKSLSDFLCRIDTGTLNKRCFESWVKAGVFDEFKLDRASLFNDIPQMFSFVKKYQEESNSKQNSLFGDVMKNDTYTLNKSQEWSSDEKLKNELEVIGFYLSAHPLDRFSLMLEKLRVKTYAQVMQGLQTASSIQCHMLLILTNNIKPKMGPKGKYAFMSVSDTTGSFELSIYNKELEQFQTLLVPGEPLLISVFGKKNDDGSLRFSVRSIEKLDEVELSASSNFMASISSEENLNIFESIINKAPQGKSKFWLEVVTDDANIEIQLKKTFFINQEIISDFRKYPELQFREL
ncbi:MAG: DNA polymerase III subunit alpha [Alphaproteobacteria bacterium]|nr:DNA polymerase III subunit alpha [Alphaproteobacteria bacterium]